MTSTRPLSFGRPPDLEPRKSKKLIDAYVQTCELVEKRSKTPERLGAPAARGAQWGWGWVAGWIVRFSQHPNGQMMKKRLIVWSNLDIVCNHHQLIDLGMVWFILVYGFRFTASIPFRYFIPPYGTRGC